MFEKILNQIVELDNNKPSQNNNYNSRKFEEIKSLLINAEICIDAVDGINEFVSYFDFNEELFIKYKKINSYEKPTKELIEGLVLKIENSIENLSKLSGYDKLNAELDIISKSVQELNSYVKVLKDELFIIKESEIKEYNKEHSKLISDLQAQIDYTKQQEELKSEELFNFLNSYDFSEDFVLYQLKYNGEEKKLANQIGFEMPELINFCTHNFSTKDNHNLLFINYDGNVMLTDCLFKNIFLRIIYHFDPKLLHIQPIGILPLKLNATLSNLKVNNICPIESSIIDEKNFEKYLSDLYREIAKRINKYKDYKDFYEYNLLNPTNPDKAIIIFLYDYPNVCNKICNLHIQNLLNSDCYLYGVYFIVLLETIDKNKENNLNKLESSVENRYVDFENNKYGFKRFNIEDNRVLFENNEVMFNFENEK